MGFPACSGAIAVQGAEHAFPLDHFPQPAQHRGAGFFFHQLRVVDLAPGIVQNQQQVLPALILKPAVLTAIDVQQHARQRSPWPPLAMLSALASPRGQPRSLQHSFDPAVAELNLVLAPELLVEVPHVQIEVALAIQLQCPFRRGHRHPLGRRLAPPPVK